MPIQRVCHLMVGQQEEAPAGDAFVFTVQTAGADETFTLPLESDGTYDFTVNWGDTNSDDISTWDAAAKTHTYASAGTHEISITGTLYGFKFGYMGDRAKIYELKSFGNMRLGNNTMYFAGCSNLTITATDILDLTGMTTLEYAFWACTSMTTVPSMNSWDVSGIENFDNTFDYTPLFDQAVGNWNTSSALSMIGTFFGAVSFDQDLSGWDYSNVLDMTYFLKNVTLSTANYDVLLISMESQAVQNNVNFHGGDSKYSAGAAATAKQALIDDHSWFMEDGGLV